MEPIRQHLLALLIFLPAAGGIACALVRRPALTRRLALITTAAVLGLSLLLLIPPIFDWTRIGLYGDAGAGGLTQLVKRAPLIPSIDAEYLIGIDGLSLAMVIVSSLLSLLAVLASWRKERAAGSFLGMLLILESGAVGALLALDGLLHFLFLQVALVSTCILIRAWGGRRRGYAAGKCFLYTFAGSMALLVGLIAIHQQAGSFNLLDLPGLLKPVATAHPGWAMGVFALLVGAFLVLLRGIPLHRWLADVHVEGPTPLSMIVAGVLPMLGGYGLLRIAFPLFPVQAQQAWPWLAGLALAGILGGALAAMGQRDFKRVIACCSIAQTGFVLLGIAMLTPAAVGGAVFLLVAQGLTGAGLVLAAGVVHDRTGERVLRRLGGLATSMPELARFAALFMFAGLGLPGLCNFVGVLMVLMGTFAASYTGPLALRAEPGVFYLIGGLATLGHVLIAGAMLRAWQRVFHGPVRPVTANPGELTTQERIILWTLGVLVVSLGIFPWPLLLMFVDAGVAGWLEAMR